MKSMSYRVRAPTAYGGILALTVLSLASSAAPLAGQTATGRVTIAGTGQPARGAWMALLDSLDAQRHAILTDTAGRFLLRAPAFGSYRVRAQLIGHADAISGTITLGPGAIVTLDLSLEERALPLEAITVEAERLCEATPEAGAAAILWEEIRKALDAVRQTGQAGLVAYRIKRHQREFGLDGVMQRERLDTLYSSGARPFTTPPPDELVEKGYVQGFEALSFYAPDAEILLSDGFAATHCFRVRRGRDETAALVGLGFEPNAGRSLPDVAGTLWIDTATAALRFMQFNYTGVDYGPRTRELGGRLDFTRLPNGAWIVEKWRIRGPVLFARRASTGGVERRRISSFLEAGAEVVEILPGRSRRSANIANR